MSWFWGSSSSAKKANDPYGNLDSGLQDFLHKETESQDIPQESNAQRREGGTAPGVNSQASLPNSKDPAPSTYRSQLGLTSPSLDQNHQNSNPAATPKPDVPPESLFQDGRYAHLWKTYQPQQDVESVGSTDQDRLAHVVETYNERRAQIGRTAVENCIFEQLAEKDCLVNGSWSKRMNMCRDENRAFNRCYTMQSRFLKALGYLAMDRTPEEDERIQMHADKLYHEMLAREKRAEEARERGEEAEVLPPLIEPKGTAAALGEQSAWARHRQKAAAMGQDTRLSHLSADKRQKVVERIKDMSEMEKEVELQLVVAETRAEVEYAEKIRDVMKDEQEHRRDRRERGKETFGDSIKRLWGWDK
ncbi:hypothetical protein MBLNU230_g2605t1 [Neophaeotheca triangularis]